MATDRTDMEHDGDDILKCPICLEIYKEPKYLPCLHTFCKSCLQSYIVSSLKENSVDSKTKVDFNCPICRVPVIEPVSATPVDEFASHFPNNHLILTLMDKKNLQSDVKYCDPCQSEETNIIAVTWCKVCSEALCDVCSKCHRKMAATKQHKLLKMTEIDVGKLDIIRLAYCETHKGEVLKAFCVDHDQPCCVTCVTINHRKCDQVTTLEDAAKGARDNPHIQKLLTKTFDTQEVVQKALESVRINKDDLKNQKSNIKEEISTLRRQVSKHLDDLEAAATRDMEAMFKADVIEIGEIEVNLENKLKSIQNYRRLYEASVKQANDIHVFLETKKIAKKQNEMEDYLKQSLPYVQRIDYKLENAKDAVDKIFSMTSFGKVSRHKESVIETSDLKQIVQPDFSLKRCCSFDVGSRTFDGIFLSNDTILLSGNDMLYHFTRDGKKLTDFCQNGSLYRVIIKSEREIIVSRPVKGKIYILDTNTGRLIEKHIGVRAYGITLVKDELFAACTTAIYCISTCDYSARKLEFDRKLIECESIASFGNTLYFTDSTNDMMYACTTDMVPVFEYSHRDLKRPCGVTTDKNGLIYIVGNSSSTVHQVSEDGKLVKIILTQKDGIEKPIAIHFNSNNEKVLILNKSNTVKIYEKTFT